MIRTMLLAASVCALTLGVAGCEREGSAERAGEEVDEAIDSVQRGGESAGERIDDAADEVREGAREAADEARGE